MNNPSEMNIKEEMWCIDRASGFYVLFYMCSYTSMTRIGPPLFPLTPWEQFKNPEPCYAGAQDKKTGGSKEDKQLNMAEKYSKVRSAESSGSLQ